MNKRFYFNKLSNPMAQGEQGLGSDSGAGPGAAGVAAMKLRQAVPSTDRGQAKPNSLQHSNQFSLPSEVFIQVKRGFDIVVSVFALMLFGLILPVLAIIIKLDSPGPIFYSQDRVGINRRRRSRRNNERNGGDRRKVLQPGSPFKVHKLRTMGVNAEASGPQWASKNDVRVTRVGRFLRKTRLDEVPQFWNVLQGEMSLVGPRPERLVFVRQLEKDIPEYHDRLLVLPGITGLAQVINGYDDSLDSVRRKVELDRQYIRSAGFTQEGRILFNTVGVVLKGEGAR